ncbi:MAG: hypothetical protein CME55_03385 [Halieaceae bacterium]|nr:hypothetical protein [Halieaceae bacterium]
MSGTFVIRNQLGHYWGKSGVWLSGSRASLVACWEYRDEAVNTLFELGSKDTELRGEVFEAEAESGQPKNLIVSEHPVPVVPEEDSEEPDGSLETPSTDPH